MDNPSFPPAESQADRDARQRRDKVTAPALKADEKAAKDNPSETAFQASDRDAKAKAAEADSKLSAEEKEAKAAEARGDKFKPNTKSAEETQKDARKAEADRATGKGAYKS